MSDTKKNNMFSKLVQNAAKAAEIEPQAIDQPEAEAPPSPPLPVEAKPKATNDRKKSAQTFGKKANPNYCQANAYIQKTVRRSVDRALLDMDGMDYSMLVEELLIKWLKSRRVSD